MRKKLLLLFLIFTSYANAQKNSHPVKSNVYSIVLRFELIQDLIVVDSIRVNDRTGKFIFDTGNQASLVLNSEAFKVEIASRPDKQTPADTARGITGNISGISTIAIDSLQIGDFIFTDFDAIAFNLEHVKEAFGENLLGFIGYGILKAVELAIDYKNKLIYLYRIDENGNTLDSTFYEKTELLDFSMAKGSAMANIYYGGRMLNFFLDTGAPKNSLDASVLPEIDETYITFTGLKDTLSGGDGNVLLTDDAFMSGLSVGGLVFNDMAVNVYPFRKGAGYDATLGYPFFVQKMFAINFKKQKLYVCE